MLMAFQRYPLHMGDLRNQQTIRAAIKPTKYKTGKIVLKSQQITAVTSSQVSNPPINFLSNLINGILRHARHEEHVMHWPTPQKRDFLGNIWVTFLAIFAVIYQFQQFMVFERFD